MDEEQLQQMQVFMAQMLQTVKPFIIEKMVRLQEDPETAFVTVVGGEALIDFDRMFNSLFAQ